MGKRVMVIMMSLVISLVAMPRTSAEAHWINVGGTLYWTTLGCQWNLKGVPNTLTVPSQAECVATGFIVDVLCENSQGHQNKNPGQSARQTVIVGEHTITPGDFTGKGKATVLVDVATDPVFSSSEFCVNDGWHVVQFNPPDGPYGYIVQQVTVDYNVYDCTDETCLTRTLASTAEYQCALPSGYNLDNFPTNLPPEGTQYSCTQVFNRHLR
jgi:hypothetical protein